MKRGWIIELEPGVYKSDCVGRTVVLENAKRYGSISAATHGLAVMRSMGPNFLNAKIYHDDHIEAVKQDDGKAEVGDWVSAQTKPAQRGFYLCLTLAGMYGIWHWNSMSWTDYDGLLRDPIYWRMLPEYPEVKRRLEEGKA